MVRADLVATALTRIDRLPDKTLRLLIGHLRKSGDWSGCELAISELEQRRGPSGTTLDLYAELAEAKGEITRAWVMREDRVLHYPDELGWMRLAGYMLDYAPADAATRLQIIEQELDRFPTSDLTLEMTRAEVALGRGRIDDARTRAEALLLASPRSSRPGLLLTRIAIEQRQPDVALRFLARVQETFGIKAAQSDVRLILERANELEFQDVALLAESLLRDPALSARNVLEEELIGLFEAPPEAEIEPEPSAIEESQSDDSSNVESSDHVLQTLRDVWGYDELRPGQATVIQRVLDGFDTLAIMPTGSGKSITFQLPALILDGPVVVVSPLIALMHDQLTTLPEPLRSQATFINSTLNPHEMDQRLERIRRGEIRLIYAAPERFRQASFLNVLRSVNVRLVVIDEAHCVSMWGHDFRPDYFFLSRALEELGDPPTLAVTATATPAMAQQIGISLGRTFQTVRTSAFRDNLHYSVERLPVAKDKAVRVVELCSEASGSIIVYVSARKTAEELALILRENSISAQAYHAGMATPNRTSVQDGFLSDRIQVIVATIAFGMGINKPNVRMIIHHSPSRSLEAYIQESGRAGRDGLPSRCVMLYTPGDTGTLRRFAREQPVSISALRQIYVGIRTASAGRWCLIDRYELATLGSESDDVNVAIGLLEQAALIRRHPDSGRLLTLRWSHRSAESDRIAPADKFGQWLSRISSGSAIVTVPTAAACSELDCPPAVLERAVLAHHGVSATWQSPAVCLEMLVQDSGRKVDMKALLDRLMAAQMERTEQMIAYLTVANCRHVHLARHLGETISACGDLCDYCTKSARPGQRPVARERSRRREDPYFAALAQWRTEVARERVVPAFVIASDRLLDKIAMERPTTRSALRGLSGIGDIKDREFGAEIISVIQSVDQSHQTLVDSAQ